MGDNGTTLKQIMQDRPDVSPGIIRAIRLGMAIATGGAYTAADIAEMLDCSERHARRVSSRLVKETADDGDMAVVNTNGYLRLIAFQK